MKRRVTLVIAVLLFLRGSAAAQVVYLPPNSSANDLCFEYCGPPICPGRPSCPNACGQISSSFEVETTSGFPVPSPTPHLRGPVNNGTHQRVGSDHPQATAPVPNVFPATTCAAGNSTFCWNVDSSPVAGTMYFDFITLCSVGGPVVDGPFSATIVTKLPDANNNYGLAPLGHDTQNRWTLVGGHAKHSGGQSDIQRANHFGTSQMVAALTALGAMFSNQPKCGSSCSPCPILRYNDMSLPWGGRFDIGGQWVPPHSGHTLGTMIDISSARANGNPNGVPGDTVSEINFCNFALSLGFTQVCLEIDPEHPTTPGQPPVPAPCTPISQCFQTPDALTHWHLVF